MTVTKSCNQYFSQKSKTTPRHRVFFFPYAGGSGEVYSSWFKNFSDEIECLYAQIPGRGRRFHEEAFDQLPSLIDCILPEVVQLADVPISFFGHSMGALIAFELAHRLIKEYDILPEVVFLSGHRAPSLLHNRKPLHKLTPEELLENLRSMGGIENPGFTTLELIEPFLPSLYKDFKLCETYKYQQKSSLASKLVILWGTSDPLIQQENIHLWQKEAVNKIEYYTFEGDHFYIHKHTKAITHLIEKKLINEKQGRIAS